MAMRVRYTTIGGELISELRSAVRRDYVPDSKGSTIALLDTSNAKSDAWDYWPFGEVRQRTGTNPTPFQFIGTVGYFGDTSTRTYVRARYYNQGLGRWLTVDPLWPNLPSYSYCRNSPVSVIDPSGLAPGNPCPPPPMPPLPVECDREKKWNEFIYAFCNCGGDPNVCDSLARTYYARCNKPGPGPGKFAPPGDGFGVVAPRPILVAPSLLKEPCGMSAPTIPCRGGLISDCTEYARGGATPPGYRRIRTPREPRLLFDKNDCLDCCGFYFGGEHGQPSTSAHCIAQRKACEQTCDDHFDTGFNGLFHQAMVGFPKQATAGK